MIDNYDLDKGGVKYDNNKPRTDLLSPESILAVSQVLTYGAEKYADRNWEKGMRWGRLIGATLRHIFHWMRGEDLDPESGLHHLAHAMTDLMMLHTCIERNLGYDDRKRKFD